MQLARARIIESFSGLVGSLHRWVRMLSTAVAGCNVAELIRIERGSVLDSASKRFPHCAMCRLDRVSLQSLQRRLKRGGIHLATQKKTQSSLLWPIAYNRSLRNAVQTQHQQPNLNYIGQPWPDPPQPSSNTTPSNPQHSNPESSNSRTKSIVPIADQHKQ